MSELLRATGLTKAFRSGGGLFSAKHVHQAVRGVDVVVDRGETLAVVGESGAGKSTVGRLVLRLIEPDEGTIVLDGTDVRALGTKQLREMRKQAQMIFQDPFSSLDPRMVVEDALAVPLKLHFGLKGAELRRRVLELLDRVGIAEHQAERYPYEFSGGQLQRIAIARALAVEPDLIVCDEPVAALDVSIQAQVINLLDDLQRDQHVAYVFISHDLSLVQIIADRLAVMYQGLVVEEGPSASIFAGPRHPYTRALLDVIPVPDPRRREARSRSARQLKLAEDVRVSAGCTYAPRCGLATDECWSQEPRLRTLAGDEVAVRVACHHAEAPLPAAGA
jgi:oligopeptide transport system ATP-binding protein